MRKTVFKLGNGKAAIMILYEFEGKELLRKYGIEVPNSQLVPSYKDIISLKTPFFIKAQTLSGNRAKAGGIVEVKSGKDFIALEKMFGKKIKGEKVEKVLVEEKVSFKREHYISLYYDTTKRVPVLLYGSRGGSGIEKRKTQIFTMDAKGRGMSDIPLPRSVLNKLSALFFSEDCLLLEINPLVESQKGRKKEWIALDAKIDLDSTAAGRHKWEYKPRSASRSPTFREIAAKKIDEGDYRGTAGSSYFDMKGDIGILASGGGASLVALDALVKEGGKPANYTEYSGNPSKEKVEQLTKIVLSKADLNGLWVIGGVANFTDIYETLSGLVEGLRKVRQELGLPIDYPIVVRRGGPREKEAFKMLAKVKDFDFHVFGRETSITESAIKMVQLSASYKKRKI